MMRIIKVTTVWHFINCLKITWPAAVVQLFVMLHDLGTEIYGTNKSIMQSVNGLHSFDDKPLNFTQFNYTGICVNRICINIWKRNIKYDVEY